MHFLIILGVLIAFASEGLGGRTPLPGAGWRAAAVFAGVVLVGLVALGLSRLTSRRLRSDFSRRRPILRAYRIGRLLHMAVLLGVFALSVHALGWAVIVTENWALGSSVLLDELLVLAPFAASLVLSWTFFYDVDRAVRERVAANARERAEPDGSSGAIETGPAFAQIGDDARAECLPTLWSRGRYVEYQVRHGLGLVLAPVVILFAAQDMLRLLWPGMEESVLGVWALGVLLVSLVLLFPYVLKYLWKARPLEGGPLRERLEAAGRRFGFRARDLLVWETYGGVANAAVAGFIPQARFVMLSDGLLRNMSDAEIEAVFGHEVGHVRHRHLLLRIWCMAALIGLAIGTAELLAGVFATGGGAAQLWRGSSHGLLLAGLAAAYIAIGFGFFSRRLERQADVFGCRFHSANDEGIGAGGDGGSVETVPSGGAIAPASVATYVGALEKLAALNGIDPRAPSWQHFSIARRVRFLVRLLEDPSHALRLERSVRLLTVLLALVSAAGIAWMLAL